LAFRCVATISTALLLCSPLLANDIVYLHGRVTLPGGGAPGRSALVELQCRGADPVKQTVAGKDGKFNWKVERDEFNHIARSLPATTTDMDTGGILSGACELRAVLKGYDSTAIDLRGFTIAEDLKLPDIVVKPKGAK
jgi:hypothetical protein